MNKCNLLLIIAEILIIKSKLDKFEVIWVNKTGKHGVRLSILLKVYIVFGLLMFVFPLNQVKTTVTYTKMPPR